jgi:hypothetical protein
MNESQNKICENCDLSRPWPEEKWEGESQPIEYECTIKEVPPDFGDCPKWKPKAEQKQ